MEAVWVLMGGGGGVSSGSECQLGLLEKEVVMLGYLTNLCGATTGRDCGTCRRGRASSDAGAERRAALGWRCAALYAVPSKVALFCLF